MKKIFAIVLLALTTSVFSQVYTSSGGSNEVLIFEAKAMVAYENKKLVISSIFSKTVAEGEKKIDLEKGDEILFYNGKRLKDLAELRKLYEATKTGSEIKLGVARKDNKFFVTLIRKEMKTMVGGSFKMGGDGKVIKMGADGKMPKLGPNAVIMGPDGKVRDANGNELSKEKADLMKKKMESLKISGGSKSKTDKK